MVQTKGNRGVALGSLEQVISVYQAYGFALWLALSGLFLLTLVWVVSLQIRLSRMSQHYNMLTKDVDGENLEQLLQKYVAHMYQTSLKVDDLTVFCQELEQSVRRAVQKVGIIRFNPFEDTGGDQSFAIALLDAAGNGVVLSSLYSRTGNRVFAKPVEAGRSRHPLTDEEREAINQANLVPAQR